MSLDDLAGISKIFNTVVGNSKETSQKGDGLFGIDWLDGNFLGSALQVGATTLAGVFGANAAKQQRDISQAQWEKEFAFQKEQAALSNEMAGAKMKFAKQQLAAQLEEARKARVLAAYQNYVASNMAGRAAQTNSVENTGASAQRAILATMR